MFDTRRGAAVRERVKCALEDLNVKSGSVFRSKGRTTMPVRGRNGSFRDVKVGDMAKRVI